MVIGICGYGATGSGAVIDLLKEFSNIQVLADVEFKYSYMVDGLQDLEFHLVKQYSRVASGDYAIKRFIEATNSIKIPLIHKVINKKSFIKIRDDYVKSLVQCSWWGMESRDYEDGRVVRNMWMLGMKKKILPFIYENRTKKNWKHRPCRKLYCSVNPKDFYQNSIKFIEDILVAKGFDLNKDIFINQCFEGNDPINSFPFFRNPKAVCINRDPRDVYLLTKLYGSMGESRWCPRDNVDDFITYYRAAHEKVHKDNEFVFRLDFEDLIYDYDNAVEKLLDFCNLKSENHELKKKYFNPEISINNTQLFLRNQKYNADIKKIENELKEYLYDFSKYDLKPDLKKKTF